MNKPHYVYITAVFIGYIKMESITPVIHRVGGPEVEVKNNMIVPAAG